MQSKKETSGSAWSPLTGAIIKPTNGKKPEVVIIEDTPGKPPNPGKKPKDINSKKPRK